VTLDGTRLTLPQILGVARDNDQVRSLAAGLDGVFSQRAQWSSAMLFRLSRARAPAARSGRRLIDEVLLPGYPERR
jgi:hypothetical protein